MRLRPCLSTGSRICCPPCRQHASVARLTTTTRGRPSSVDVDRSGRRRFEPWPLAAWGQDVEFSPAKILSATSAAPQVRSLSVDIGQGAQGYSMPGQFLQIKVADSKPAFMAIASPPGDANAVDLIVKCSGDTAEQLCELSAGDDVDVSAIMGKGFSLDRIPASTVKHVWIFATGTGIAPVRALIESPIFELNNRDTVQLYYGIQNSEASPVKDTLENWSNNYPNLKIHMVYSDDGGEYIQDVFKASVTKIDSGSSGVVLCGQRAMCEDITAQMEALGVASDRILLNF